MNNKIYRDQFGFPPYHKLFDPDVYKQFSIKSLSDAYQRLCLDFVEESEKIEQFIHNVLIYIGPDGEFSIAEMNEQINAGGPFSVAGADPDDELGWF